MSAKHSKVAATYSRGGIRTEAKKSKVVFKNVLDAPFNIPWPEISSDNNSIILDLLCELLNPIKTYRQSHATQIKMGKKSRTKTQEKSTGSVCEVIKPTPALAMTVSPSEALLGSAPPPILKYTVIGINSVTKELEQSIQNIKDHPAPSAIYICKGDLAPEHLYSHFGIMAAMLPGTLLFPLTRGSEKKLAEALGMKAVGAVAFKADPTEAMDLLMVTSRMVEPITVSWLPKASVPTAADLEPPKLKTTISGPTAGSDNVISTTSALALTQGPASTTESVPDMSAIKGTESNKEGVAQTPLIPTNIKAVKTIMPIVIKTNLNQNANVNSQKSKATNSSKINDTSLKGKNQQQQPQRKDQQSNGNIVDQQTKKHNAESSEGPAGGGGKNKKAKVK